MPDIIKILDTTIADTGPTQTMTDSFLKSGIPLRLHCDLGSGDVVKIQGRLDAAHSWDTLHTFSDETPADVYPSYYMRAIRTTDGGSADSAIYVCDPFQDAAFTAHTA